MYMNIELYSYPFYYCIVYLLFKANENIHKSSSVTSGIKTKDKVGKKKKRIASASTALLFGLILGLTQAAILIFATKPLLSVMGVKQVSFFFIN